MKKLKQAMSQQRKDCDLLLQSEREKCSAAITIAKKKMKNALTQLQKEQVMWQVLSQEVEFKIERANNESRRLVQIQIKKALNEE
jgi:hypothetical protein